MALMMDDLGGVVGAVSGAEVAAAVAGATRYRWASAPLREPLPPRLVFSWRSFVWPSSCRVDCVFFADAFFIIRFFVAAAFAMVRVPSRFPKLRA